MAPSDAMAPAQFVRWAQAVDRKLQGLSEDLDAGRRAQIASRWAFLDALPAAQAQSLRPRLWTDQLGGLPALRRLADPLARLCLLPRGEILNRLCALALGRRPGVLRCCVDREVRAPLQRALGDLFAPLVALSRHGRPVDADAAVRAPVDWACIGFLDWSQALTDEDRVVRELVRLSLPQAVLDDLSDPASAQAEHPVAHALAAFAEAGVVWPC